MIKSFHSKETAAIFERRFSKKLPESIQRIAFRKLMILDAAENLDTIGRTPGSRLERLSGDRKGQQGIRINDQWRVCFRWKQGHAYDVEITDYH